VKKIAVGDLGEFWYADYKEPFESYEGGVPGHPLGVVLQEPETGKLLCALCGGTFHRLDAHTKPKHGLSASEYRSELGLMSSSALVSEQVRQVRIRNALTHIGRDGVTGATRIRNHPNRSKGGPTSYAYARSPEYLNRSGRCLKQALTVARQIAKGSRLTQRRLSAYGIGPRTVALHFGSVTHLATMIGAEGYGHVLYTREELLTALRGLSEKLGRTPYSSDLRRYGLPVVQTYVNHFGTWQQACRAAGLEPWVPVADSDVEVEILSAYSVHGNMNRTARSVGVSTIRVQRVLHRYGFPFSDYAQTRKSWAAEMARRLAGWPEAPSEAA